MRRGMTLLEVLLAVALFLGAVTVLSQLWHGGVRASVQSRLQTQAVLRCESKLNEAIAGAVPLQTTGEMPFDDDPSWSWKLTVDPGPQSNILKVTVETLHPGQGGLSNSSHQLIRLVRDPQVWVDAQKTTTSETQP